MSGSVWACGHRVCSFGEGVPFDQDSYRLLHRFKLHLQVLLSGDQPCFRANGVDYGATFRSTPDQGCDENNLTAAILSP